jgi:hypothetical protein
VAYLRLFEQDLRDPYNRWIPPPLDRTRLFVDERDARASLAEGPTARWPWRALLFYSLLGLIAAGVWLAVRVSRAQNAGFPLALPWLELALGGAVLIAAFAVRAVGIPGPEWTCDESFYRLSGELGLRNLRLGDYSGEAFRWNWEHPPVAKWIYGLAGVLGGPEGARLVSALLSSLAVLFGACISRVLFGRVAALGTAGLLIFLPHLVAHGRLAGLESVVAFFSTGSLLCAVIWARSAMDPSPQAPRGNLAAAFLASGLAALGTFARFTVVWILPLLAVVVLGAGWRSLRQRRLGLLVPWLAGGLAGTGLAILAWPWIWSAPFARFGNILARWAGQHPSEYFLGVWYQPPPMAYYPVAFLATTPGLILILALGGAIAGLALKRFRPAVGLMLLALLLPFGQSLSVFRQDLARYVIQAWVPLCILAALPLQWLSAWRPEMLRDPAGRLGRIGRLASRPALWSAVLLVALTLYTAAALRAVEPYPLDYFNELAGGPVGVAENKTFETAWWGEGIGEAIAEVNRIAPTGARVRISAEPTELRPRLREDLVEIESGPAELVVTNHRGYRAEQPPGCVLAHRVEVAGAPLVDVYRCQ